MHDLVEKPTPEEAPSDLGVMGRYVLTPAHLRRPRPGPRPGRGGEIQLTDAIKLLLATEPVYGYTFSEGRFDVGNKLDYLRATVELALEREDLGPAFRAFLEDRLRSVMIPLAEAQAEVIGACPAKPPRVVEVGDAVGLVLAEAVTAAEDVPPFANTAMDGYAVRAADVADGQRGPARPG